MGALYLGMLAGMAEETDEGGALRIGQAASLLGVSVDTVRRWEEEGRLAVTRTAGGQRRVAVAEVRRLLDERTVVQHAVTASSARNQFDAVVTGVRLGTAAASVEMVAGPYRLVALTTAESAEELGLEPGTRVVASVKATNVVVGLPKA
jgi:molybdopterin-binding protein